MQHISDPYQEEKIFFIRIIVASLVMIVLVLVLLINLTRLQLINYEHYLELSDRNRYNIDVIAPKRGKIFDRNGEVLADNELSFALMVTLDKLEDATTTFAILEQNKIITKAQIERFQQKRQRYRAIDTIALADDLSEEQIASALTLSLPSAITVKPRLNRIYPHGDTAAHMIGYVSFMNKEDKKKYQSKDYAATNHVGKLGIEKQYEVNLHGLAGSSQVEKNVQEQIISDEVLAIPTIGYDLYLTLDLRLQLKAESLLAGKRGAVVVIDVRNGELLAAVSAPSFDANLFVNGISQKNYTALIESTDKPLFNRVIRGTYPPGSTIKPFIALAGLEYNVVDANRKIYCPGFYQLPQHSHKYRDWRRLGHGHIDIKDAIAQSCDVYFYDLAYRMGIAKIHDYLQHFGLGKKTGIDIPNEVSGILPSKEWKKANKDLPWYVGETVITGIGQGFLTVTPLQLAVATAALANNGTLYKPKLLKDIKKPNGEVLSIDEEQTALIPINDSKNWDTILDGMRRTIYDARGTARRINQGKMNYTLAGKTGTAQVFGLDQEEEYIAEQLDEKLRDHALFTAFAPYENPEIAIAVIVENAGSGSSEAAPLAKEILNVYFNNKL